MNTSGSFIFNSKKISFNEIQSWSNPVNEFEGKILAFARDWLSLKQEFSVHTSGSTGAPKPIILTRKQIQSSAQITKDFFQLQKGQQALLCLDTSFIAGKMMIVRALEASMNLICVPPKANPLEDLLTDSPISFAALVPYQLENILNKPATAKKLSQIKKIIIGGAAVPNSLAQKLQSLPIVFYETYGMTETITHVAVRRLNPMETTFRALPGVKLFLDERQCLNILAAHLGTEIIRTNDLVNLESETAFSMVGRYDNIINTAGVKVSPEDVERKISTVLLNNLSGYEYFIGGVNDQSFGELVTLFIESDDISNNLKELLLECMKPHLKKWEIPKKIICLPIFNRTESGKLNRAETIQKAIAP